MILIPTYVRAQILISKKMFFKIIQVQARGRACRCMWNVLLITALVRNTQHLQKSQAQSNRQFFSSYFCSIEVYQNLATHFDYTLIIFLPLQDYRMIIMSPIDAAAAAFGYIQHSQKNSKQNSHVTIDDENVCPDKAESMQEDSCATSILLKRFASFLGKVIRELGLAETFLQPISDIRVTARILTEMLTSVITSATQTLVPDISEDNISLDSSIYTLSEPKTPVATQPLSGGGLALLSSELLLEEDVNERLDYSISQLDVLRMSRAASRRLRVDSIDQLPTTIYHEEQSEATGPQEDHDESNNQHEERNALICSSHEGCEEEIPAPVVDGTKEIALKHTLQQGNHPEFSWLIVPEDPLQDDLTRISQHDDHLKAVPETISICSSHHSEENAFDHCVICQGTFQEGENLRVLPCGHLFHYRCIDGMQMSGDTSEEDTGCPMCKEDIEQQTGESYHSDGSVPSWSFKRLGSLLASMGK